MALRQVLGESTGEVMREDALPCSRITNALAGAASVGGVLCAWPLCVIYYGTLMRERRTKKRKTNDQHTKRNYSTNQAAKERAATEEQKQEAQTKPPDHPVAEDSLPGVTIMSECSMSSLVKISARGPWMSPSAAGG